MNEKFLALVTKFHADAQALKNDPEKYTKKIQSFHPFVASIYPQEVEKLFQETNLNKEIKKWVGAKELVKSIDSFNIDYTNKNVTVKLGEESFSAELVDVRAYLAELNINEDTWQHTLILSFFSDPQTYEMFQLTRAIGAE